MLVDGVLHADVAPKRGFLKRDAAPRPAGELGAQHDLTWPQPEEDVQNDVPGQRSPVPRRAAVAAAGGERHLACTARRGQMWLYYWHALHSIFACGPLGGGNGRCGPVRAKNLI